MIVVIVWLARTAGRPLCRALLYPISLYFLLTDRTARHASAEFLQAVQNRPTRWREIFTHIYCFAACLLDRVYMAAGEFERFNVAIEGMERVDDALRAGRGCVVLGSHLGSFDLMMLAHRTIDGRPIHIMMRIDPRSRVRRIAGIDDRLPNIIRLGQPDSFIRAYDALCAGEIVAVLADRVDGAASLPVNFLGRPTLMPVAPYVLAARAEATVLMCFGLYEGGNRYRIEFVELGTVAPHGGRGEQFRGVVERYAVVLEQFARRYPLNWFNFYPFWATEPHRP